MTVQNGRVNNVALYEKDACPWRLVGLARIVLVRFFCGTVTPGACPMHCCDVRHSAVCPRLSCPRAVSIHSQSERQLLVVLLVLVVVSSSSSSSSFRPRSNTTRAHGRLVTNVIVSEAKDRAHLPYSDPHRSCMGLMASPRHRLLRRLVSLVFPLLSQWLRPFVLIPRAYSSAGRGDY